LTSGRYERSITFTTLKIKSYPQIKNMSKLLEQINKSRELEKDIEKNLKELEF